MTEQAPKRVYTETELHEMEQEFADIMRSACNGYELASEFEYALAIGEILNEYRPKQPVERMDIKPIYFGGSSHYDESTGDELG